MGKNTGVGEEGPGGRAGSSGEGTVDLTELDAHGREREHALHSGNTGTRTGNMRLRTNVNLENEEIHRRQEGLKAQALWD